MVSHRERGRRWLYALAGLCLSGCVAAPSPQAAQPFDARDHFHGRALALAQAVDRKDAAAIDRLIAQEHLDPDALFDAADAPMLAWPVINGNAEGLKQLLDAGADPNARRTRPERRYGQSRDNALVYAARAPDPVYLRLLLDRGGDPDTRNADGEPLLYVATLARRWANVRLLVLRGARVNEGLSGGGDANTVLHWYSSHGAFEQVDWLLRHGGDPTRTVAAGPGTPGPGRMPIVEDIDYAVVAGAMVPWQRRCQHWLRDHGIARAPGLGRWQRYREQHGLPSRPQDIPQL